MSTLGDPADVNLVIKFLPHIATVNHVAQGAYMSPLMPHDLSPLRQRIVKAVADFGCQMLQHVWQELDYMIDI
jgi:hypothetical protein